MSEQVKEQLFDVVIVGGGGSGLAAAIAAREADCRVALLEKNQQLGGSTALSIGSITATGTPHQLKRGIEDNPADHWADMSLFPKPEIAARDNAELRRILCNEAPETFRWLMSLGVQFYGPMPEPPHRQPRMHNVLPNSASYIYHLKRRASDVGVDIRLSTRASVLVERAGRVIAVDVNEADGAWRFVARRGVILATGDFTNNPELKARYIGAQEAKIEGLNVTATGDGQLMALQLGARVVNGDLALGPQIRFIAPTRPHLLRRLPPSTALAAFMQWALDHTPQALLRPLAMGFLTTALAPSPAVFENGALLVNKMGQRFCNECNKPEYALPSQPDNLGYILVDNQIADRFLKWPNFISTAPGIAYAYIDDYRRNRRDVYSAAASLAALAGKLGMQPSVLCETVSKHNEAVATGMAASRPQLLAPPFIALGPVRSVFVHNEGGLAVDDQHRVLNSSNLPIPGLYACGSTGQGGLLLEGHGHHLAWAFVSGRRAGRISATAESPNERT